jgi:3-oxoacyl-[acyl-carrier protein] reductase
MTRTALIGGASKGIGFGCAQALAAAGCRVVMCARTEAELRAAAESIRAASSGEAIAIPCDFSQKAQLAALKDELGRARLEIDILVNNTGGPPPGIVTDVTDEQWESGIDLLLRSTLHLYRMVLPGMRTRKWGRIVNILSTTAIEPVPTLAVSSVLRSAIAAYSKLVAVEVARDGVTVNSLMPGSLATARTESLMRDAAQREGNSLEVVRQRIEATLPMRRMLDPKELGEVVRFLASDAGSGMTGALFPVDGGGMKSL